MVSLRLFFNNVFTVLFRGDLGSIREERTQGKSLLQTGEADKYKESGLLEQRHMSGIQVPRL